MDDKKNPLKHEEKYFLEQERAAIERLRAERAARLKAENQIADKKREDDLKAAHWLCCPKCGHGMETVDYAGTSVERCTKCEGLFFDRGELEDIFLKKLEDRRNIFRKILGI